MRNKGVLFGIGAYLIWGFFPIYFKTMQVVPPAQILFHRIAWSFLLLAVLLLLRGQWRDLRAAITGPKMLAIYAIAACLLAINWLTYVWGVNAGYVVETSLGYFINPLVNVALGFIFLRERFTRGQTVALGLAAIGVGQLIWQAGHVPWIALTLAFSFGFYGLLRKLAPVGPMVGLAAETSLLAMVSAAATAPPAPVTGVGLGTVTLYIGSPYSVDSMITFSS